MKTLRTLRVEGNPLRHVPPSLARLIVRDGDLRDAASGSPPPPGCAG